MKIDIKHKPFFSVVRGLQTIEDGIMEREIESEFDISQQMFDTIFFQSTSGFMRNNNIVVNSNKKQKKIDKQSRLAIPPKMRWAVMQRDNFRCVKCGRSAQETEALNVDHIIPVTKTTERRANMDDLQTLCWDCNVGKFNKLELNKNGK